MTLSSFHRALDDGEAVRTEVALLVVSVVVVVTLASSASATDGCSSNLTAGFVQVELAEGNFVVQSPYDVAENQRYSYDNVTGVRTFLVYAGDKPFNTVTGTNPRTEVRLTCHDYSSGVWQFEGYGYVPTGTSGVSVMQIHNEDGGAKATTLMLHVYNGTLWYYDRQVVEGCIYDRWFRLNVVHDVGVSVMQIHNEDGGAKATTLMLHVYNGTLRYYDRQVVEGCIYDRWFRLNVVHDVGVSTVAVYVDGEPRLAVDVTRSALHYFKFGVYVMHHNVSSLMESRWRNITVYTKPY